MLRARRERPRRRRAAEQRDELTASYRENFRSPGLDMPKFGLTEH
jgi:hypothetical protein